MENRDWISLAKTVNLQTVIPSRSTDRLCRSVVNECYGDLTPIERNSLIADHSPWTRQNRSFSSDSAPLN